MGGTRKARVPMSEQIRLINECRQSGMTDVDWCRENDIAVSTFYNWVSRCRKAAADQIPGVCQVFCGSFQWCVDEDFCAEAAKCLQWDSVGIPWLGNAEEYVISEKDRNGVGIWD